MSYTEAVESMFEFSFQKCQAEEHRLAGEQQKRKVGQKGARRLEKSFLNLKLNDVKYFFSPPLFSSIFLNLYFVCHF